MVTRRWTKAIIDSTVPTRRSLRSLHSSYGTEGSVAPPGEYVGNLQLVVAAKIVRREATLLSAAATNHGALISDETRSRGTRWDELGCKM